MAGFLISRVHRGGTANCSVCNSENFSGDFLESCVYEYYAESELNIMIYNRLVKAEILRQFTVR